MTVNPRRQMRRSQADGDQNTATQERLQHLGNKDAASVSVNSEEAQNSNTSDCRGDADKQQQQHQKVAEDNVTQPQGSGVTCAPTQPQQQNQRLQEDGPTQQQQFEKEVQTHDRSNRVHDEHTNNVREKEDKELGAGSSQHYRKKGNDLNTTEGNKKQGT